ncbi:MAG: hypothetical protein M0R80_00145 [Proteobacteria bacterium]|nr:hypothetical protein [Pseudomonadota bacterium]
MSRHRAIPVAAFLAAMAALAGCGTKRAQQECRLESESVVAETGAGLAAVAAARVEAFRYAAAWSAGGETLVAALDAGGRRLSDPLRVDRGASGDAEEESDGGPIAFWPEGAESSFAAEDLEIAALDGGGAALAILERRSESRSGGAFAALLAPGLTAVEHVVGLGPAGPFSSRVSAAGWRGDLLAAWHDAAVDASTVRVAIASRDGRLRGTASLPGTKPAYAPSIAVARDAALLVWIESRPSGYGTRFDLRSTRVSPGPALAPASTIASARYVDPAPVLVRLGDGFGLAFRDDRDGDHIPEYYFAKLDASGKPAQEPARISRADGPDGPRLARVGPFVFGVQVRTFGGSLLVGMNRFDAEGRKRGGEFQIYADKSDFTHADVAPGDGKVLLVYGEERKGEGRVLAGPVTCRGM